MNEQDLVDLRDLHAGLALMGLIGQSSSLLLIRDDRNKFAKLAYDLADAMQEARAAGAGIAAVKRHNFGEGTNG